MAPIPASSYFPSLDQCLSGDELLISWKLLFSAVKDNEALINPPSNILKSFLEDEEVLNILVDPFTIPEPSPQSKNAFDTKTSPINVTPSANTQYNIQEIKEDALWLSNATKIEEVAALRLVVEEYQSRAEAQLLGPFSEEELVSIRDSAGNNKYSSSIPTALTIRGPDAQDVQKDFDSQQSRRKRIFRQYLSERQYLLKCTEWILESLFDAMATPENPQNKDAFGPPWLTDSLQLLRTKLVPDGDILISRYVSGIERNLQNIGGDCFDEEGRRDDPGQWTRSQITEAIHSMELIWQILNYVVGFPSSTVALQWFRLQRSVEFVSRVDADEASIQELLEVMQAISAIISVSILAPANAVELLSTSRNINEQVSADAPMDRYYIFNTKTILEINSILLFAADNRLVSAGPAILSWTIILATLTERMMASELRESSRYDQAAPVDLESLPDPYKDVLEQINDNLEDDIVDYLARTAVDSSRVFECLGSLCARFGNTSDAFFSSTTGAQMRSAVLTLIKYSTRAGYGPEIMTAALSALTGGQNYWDLLKSDTPLGDDPVENFAEDEVLIQAFLETAKSRYPYESLPFLQILRAVASPRHSKEGLTIAEQYLERMRQFTCALPPDFMDYETTQEEDNNNTIQLTRPLQLFVPRFNTLRSQATAKSSLIAINSDFYLPAGTLGRMVSESGPRVASWFHEFSGLAYLGKLLETYLAASDVVDVTTGMPADPDSVAEIIELLAVLVSGSGSVSKTGSEQSQEKILAEASSGLSHDRDITAVIFEIFLEELQNISACPGSNISLDVLVSCVHFIHSQIHIAPGRVWPLIARGGLLDMGRGRARLPTIVEGIEVVSGRYEFLLSVCHLFEALVDDFALNAIRRRSDDQVISRNGRMQFSQNRRHDVSTGISENTLSKVLLSFARYLNEVLESSRTWKYNTQDDRRRIHHTIGTAFTKILRYAFGIDASTEPEKDDNPVSERALSPWSPQVMDEKKAVKPKVMEALMAPAIYLVESFLPTTSGTLRFQTLLQAFFDGFETPEFTIFPNMVDLWICQVCTMLEFSQVLLRVSALLDLPSSRLETQIFQSSSLVARLYAANDRYRNKVVTLFEILIGTASDEASQPASLLGYLGPKTSRHFLHSISDLDKPLSRGENLKTIWHFLSIIMNSRQHGFANYILTGKTAKDAVQSKIGEKELGAPEKSLLTTALASLIKIGELSTAEKLAMLEFVVEAQDLRAWTVFNSPLYAKFIQSILNFVGDLKPLHQDRRIDSLIGDCNQTRIAAYIAEILSMHVFYSKQAGFVLSINDLLKNLSYFSRFAVAVPAYNSALHGCLKSNFENRYPGCTVLDLKRTTLQPRELGSGWFYDMSLADRMFSHDSGWNREDGLRVEFERANINLSLVEAQIALFNGWERLCSELTKYIGTEPGLQTMLASVVNNCLVANGRSQPPEEIFSTLSQRRAQLAQILSQRLSEAKSSIPEMKSLLPMVWTTISNLRGSFERPVPEGDIIYYRALLNLLYIALLIHARTDGTAQNSHFGASVGRGSQSIPIVPVILDVLKHVVAMGFRELASSIHDSPADSSPGDVRLITGILQACLHIPGIELCYAQIVTLMIDNQVPLNAIRLFSWSEKLAINGDPIYGELSILFLLELSSVQPLAEQLALGGILGRLSSMDIMSYFRRPGVSPFAESAGLQRCYRIWAVGILPLLLNLLYAVEGSIAIEVAQFLNQFPLMLTQSEEAFDAPETNRLVPRGQKKYITFTVCSETNHMAGVYFILDSFRKQCGIAIPEVKWDAAGVLENVEFWLGSKALLRERILPMGPLEDAMVKRKIDTGKTVSLLEQKVVAELMLARDVIGSMDSA
ncbi:hypothetical protein LZ554_009400 [Drepanopeziza brunnea f. sp. 'monogermtubi']|nr:hypothetical protein LZ554_009400 [Drepanopeziza brunnea f. sp. 'monogermtubi']